jgi:hypothetical protein
MLQATSHLIDAYIHEVGLYGALQGGLLSVTRFEILYDCLKCTWNYASTVLPLSDEQIEGWSCFDWRQLNYVIMLATKIVMTIHSAVGNEDSISQIVRLDDFVEGLCIKVRTLYLTTNTPRGQHHCFQKLLSEWQKNRSWYRAVKGRAAAQAYQTIATRPDDGPVPRTQPCQGTDIGQVQEHWMDFDPMEHPTDGDIWVRTTWGAGPFTGLGFL